MSDQRAGGGFEFALSRKVNFNIGALFGFSPVYLPETDVYGELDLHRLSNDGRRGGEARGIRRRFYLCSIGPELIVKFSDGFDTSITYLRGNTSCSIASNMSVNMSV